MGVCGVGDVDDADDGDVDGDGGVDDSGDCDASGDDGGETDSCIAAGGTTSWLGDGWCDYLGGCGWEGPLYNCLELAYDCGDCNDDWNGYDPANLCTNLLLGDFNNDDNIDVLDIVILVNHILSPATVVLDGSDINEDGNVDVLDIVQLINIILN